MNVTFIPRVIWAGFKAFWSEGLWYFLWSMWRDHPEVKRAVEKWRTGTPGQPGKTSHLMRNIGQELFQAINEYDDEYEGGEDGKRAYKIAAGLMVTTGIACLLIGAGIVATVWVIT